MTDDDDDDDADDDDDDDDDTSFWSRKTLALHTEKKRTY